MVKEFLYRGLPKEELDNMSLEKLFQIFNARQRRSLTRGITDDKRKLIEEIKSAKAGKLKNPIKTHSRDLIILPYMVGVTVNIFSGKEFTPVLLKSEMIGHYLGEYVITYKRGDHRNGRLRRDARDRPPDVLVQHHIAEHEDAAAGEPPDIVLQIFRRFHTGNPHQNVG